MLAQVLRLLPIAAAAAFALPASAGEVTLSGITGVWQNAFGGGNPPPASGTVTGLGTSQVRWGDPSGQPNKSGYNFGAVAGPLIYNLPPNTPIFSLGSFEHLNFPIDSGTSITGIQLKVTANVSIDGNDQGNKNFLFDFTHNETPNGADPCANGGDNGDPPNQNGCADSVKLAYNTDSEVFVVDGEEYTLNVFGFSMNSDGTNPFTEWWTAENKQNTAYLVANITLKDQVGPPAEIPEPSTFALAGLAVFGLAAARRRKAR